MQRQGGMDAIRAYLMQKLGGIMPGTAAPAGAPMTPAPTTPVARPPMGDAPPRTPVDSYGMQPGQQLTMDQLRSAILGGRQVQGAPQRSPLAGAGRMTGEMGAQLAARNGNPELRQKALGVVERSLGR